MSPFHVRLGSLAENDNISLLKMFDSQLSWLVEIGSGDQWGSTPFSGNHSSQAKYRYKVERSESMEGHTWNSEWGRVYIAEVDVPSNGLHAKFHTVVDENTSSDQRDIVRVPVAAMILEAKSPDYVLPVLPEQDEADSSIYLSYLLSDRTLSSVGKGAGAALIAHAKDEVSKLGLRRMCCDCWRGNGRRLVKYSRGYYPQYYIVQLTSSQQILRETRFQSNRRPWCRGNR